MRKSDGSEILSSVFRLGDSGGGFAIVSFLKSDGNIEKVILEGPDYVPSGGMDKAVLAAARDLLSNSDGRSSLVQSIGVKGFEGEPGRLILEIVRPKVCMNVFGAGHVGQAVCMLGALLGYRVTVYDDRQDLLTRERFPDNSIRLLHCYFGDIGSALSNIQNSVNVIVTRGHQYDEECLRAIIGRDTAYIGMIGSRRRVLSIFKRLVDSGVKDELLSGIHAPIGLRIGAVSPQEIAVSILAEVIQVLNHGVSSGRY
jgi:xanthine dehydrogenase accessory factor